MNRQLDILPLAVHSLSSSVNGPASRFMAETDHPRAIGQAAALMILFAVAGCTAVPIRGELDSVRQVVSARAGCDIKWPSDSSPDVEIDAAVEKWLAGELTIEQAVQVALMQNRHLQATLENLGIAQADLVQAGLLKNPVLFASLRFPDRAPHGVNSEFSVTQDFLDLIIMPLRKKVAARQLASTKFLVGNEVLQLVADVKGAYFTLAARQQLLARLQDIVELNATAAELAQRQHEAGTINELSLVRQNATLAQSRAEAAQVKAQAAADREHLNRLLGLSGRRVGWKIAPRLPDLPSEEVADDDLESFAMRQRLDLAAMGTDLQSLAELLAVQRGFRYFASVDVGVDTERDPAGQHVVGPTVALQLPVFDQGQARIARTEAEFRQLQRRFQALAIDARSEVREARDQLLAKRRLVEDYRLLLSQRKQILNLTLEQYGGMLKGPYDLLLAKQDEVITERAYLEAWRDYWIARTQLEKAVGGKLPPERGSATQPLSSVEDLQALHSADSQVKTSAIEHQSSPGIHGDKP